MALGSGLALAAQALEAKRYTTALDILLPLSRSHEDIAEVWQQLALAYKGLEQFPDAEDAFRRSLAISPQSHVWANLGNLYKDSERLQEACDCYQRALTDNPENSLARVNLGQVLLQLHRVEEAARHFSELLERQPEHVSARLGLARSLQYLGYHNEATELFHNILREQPDNADALNGLGLSLRVFGHADEAANVLSQAVELEPGSAEFRANLASALAQSDRPAEAVAAYQAALTLDPDNPELHDWYNAYLGVIDHPDYLNSYREALAWGRASSELIAAFAHKLTLNHRQAEAIEVLQAALSTQPGDSVLERELSHALRQSGDFVESLEVARSAAQRVPDDVAAAQELATAIMAAGDDYEEAVALLARLVHQYPNDQGLWALYASALRYAENYDAYHQLISYDTLVNYRYIEVPEGFSGRDNFVGYLRNALLGLHCTQRHPVEQSMVNGTQSLDDLFSRRDPAIRQLVQALKPALAGICAALPANEHHPLLRRNSGGFAFSDSWSVLLRQAGYHKNHFHSEGWLSSAFYLRVPAEVAAGAGGGWLKFGQPGFRAREPLEAEYWIRPDEGMLVVFPSYLWHGTEPLAQASERMTVGYDILPL